MAGAFSGGNAARMLDEERFYKWATKSCQETPPIVNLEGNPNFRELLERARAVMVDIKDEHQAAAAQPKQALSTPDLHETSQSGLNCFRCGSLYHQAKDGMQRSSFRNQR